jgi:Pla-1/cef family extracellular lipase
MKKLVISLAIATALGLSGCGTETVEDVKKQVAENGTQITEPARVIFDPANGVLSVPNDLLFSGTTDGTLNMPGESKVDENGMPAPDYLDPATAIGALDGWSTINPFVLDINFPEGKELDGDSVFNPASVRVFKALMGGDSGCEEVPRGAACTVVEGGELKYLEDFVTQKTGNSVAVVPLKPLEADTSYIVVMTNNLLDLSGDPIKGSTTYELVRQDINTKPLGSEAQKGLQAVINSYEKAVVDAGVDSETIIYTSAMTTQSIQNVSQVVKSLMLSGVPGTTPILSAVTPTGANAAYFLGLDQNDLGAGTVASFASVSKSTLSAPYYLNTPFYDGSDASCNLLAEDVTQGCPDLFSRWEAMGDSPVTVLGALQSGVLTQASFAEQAIAQGKDPSELIANPAMLVGLTFTINIPDGMGGTIAVAVDQARHLTQYNPLPQVKSYKAGDSAIDVMVTTPDADRVNAIATLKKGAPLTEEEKMVMPEGGWPVMIYSHGITAYKETVLAISGALASQGIATISIDHPYHGTRGIDFNGDGVYEISATEALKGDDPAFVNASVTSYMNLASLLTARDNVRQSEVDLLALRLSLNGAAGQALFDVNKVSFMGHSLGGIAGTAFAALANSGIIDPATGTPIPNFNPYAIKSVSLAMPGGGIPGVLLNSPSFGPVVMAGLTSTDAFKDLVEGAAGKPYEELTEEEIAVYTAAIYPGFAAQFNFAAQAIMDASDPINYASTVKATMTPVHVMEVIGDTESDNPNKADQVIVNAVGDLPLVGTEPLISALGLSGASSSVGNGVEGVSAAVRFTRGHHSSILSPYPVEGVATDDTLAVTVEMQTQVASFAASGGTRIVISDNPVIIKPVE